MKLYILLKSTCTCNVTNILLNSHELYFIDFKVCVFSKLTFKALVSQSTDLLMDSKFQVSGGLVAIKLYLLFLTSN
eukprot:jgi/Galph1/5698/GphlegSOOS_G4413.1